MNKVYLDNAATTKLDENVLNAMMPLMREDFESSLTHPL